MKLQKVQAGDETRRWALERIAEVRRPKVRRGRQLDVRVVSYGSVRQHVHWWVSVTVTPTR